MARLISFSAIFALVLLSHLSGSMAKADAMSVEVESYNYKDIKLPKEPKPGYFKSFLDCAHRCTEHCGRVFGDYLNGKGQSSVICCRNLINDIRFKCHFKIAAGIMLYKEFRRERVDILERAMQLWNKCEMIVTKYGPGKPRKML